jgi:hypothetical protein
MEAIRGRGGATVEESTGRRLTVSNSDIAAAAATGSHVL